ncbi:bacterio-opsin activator domain-containing protein [Natrarchaeobaculum sulfurireducens]|uniref:bacterio-opsin activator domain-containing protein n=1 Tax=Natrarchaeobaculum sulfurireducens TaxID=2044521 RepID=UPI000E3DA35C|nr:bacterio-opsin activator domain-containing protein [Natrarchaeobaculum sulfurireducens]
MNSTTPSRGTPRSRELIRVLFVDTGATTVRAAKSVFEDEFGIDVTVASRSDDVFRSLESVDCVVQEIRPPIVHDLDVLEAVCDSFPGLPYIVFSEIRATDLVGEALSQGATDYVRTDADDAGYWLLASRVRRAVDRRYGDELERSDGFYSDVVDGSCLLDESGSFVAVSASYGELFGYDPEHLIGESLPSVFPASEASTLETVFDRVRRRGRTVEEVTARRRDGDAVPVLVSLARRADDQYVCTVFDRSDRTAGITADTDHDTIGLERALSRLEAMVTERLGNETETDTDQDLCEAVVEVIENGNESAAVAIYLYDEPTDGLSRRAVTTRFDESATTLSFEAESTPAWTAFVERTPVFVADVHPEPAEPVQNPAMARGLVVPVGTAGVLVAGTIDGTRLTPLDHAFVRLSSATAGTVLDRIESQRCLSECHRRLERANLETERFETRLDLVRHVARVIGRAWTRPELERAICEHVVATGQYDFVRIADVDEVDERVRERTWAGAEKPYLERLDSSVDTLVGQGEPMATAIETKTVQASRHLLTGSVDEQWRQEAVTRGYRSIVGVPLVFRERTYGGLAVYSEQPDRFDDAERDLFEDLGRWVAQAIHAIETRAALVGRGGVELEFRVRDREIEFLEWARETGCAFEFETVVSRPDGSIRGFFTISGAPVERILELASRSPSVTETRLVTQRGDRHLFECTFTEDSVVARLLEYGVLPKTMSASEDAGRLVVSLPDRTTVREFVGFFTGLYPDSTLVRRQDHEFVDRPGYGFRSDLENALTDKQFEALETAFLSGYFDVPRETTGEGVADLLGVSQPTFNNHLRVAQRKLLSIVFTDDPDPKE